MVTYWQCTGGTVDLDIALSGVEILLFTTGLLASKSAEDGIALWTDCIFHPYHKTSCTLCSKHKQAVHNCVQLYDSKVILTIIKVTLNE